LNEIRLFEEVIKEAQANNGAKFKDGDEVIHLGHNYDGVPYFKGKARVIEVERTRKGFIYKTDVVGCYIPEEELRLA